MKQDTLKAEEVYALGIVKWGKGSYTEEEALHAIRERLKKGWVMNWTDGTWKRPDDSQNKKWTRRIKL